MKKALLIFIAEENFSDFEFLVLTNSLKQAGVNYFIASDAPVICRSDKNKRVKNDVSLTNIHSGNFGGLVYVGGKGILNYRNNIKLKKITNEFYSAGKPVAAICASPVILCDSGILNGAVITANESVKDELLTCGIIVEAEGVCVSGNIITASGPQYTADFTAEILNYLNN